MKDMFTKVKTFFLDEEGFAWNWDPEDMEHFDPNLFLSWDGFHPTSAAHVLLAHKAMEVIPFRSWWKEDHKP